MTLRIAAGTSARFSIGLKAKRTGPHREDALDAQLRARDVAGFVALDHQLGNFLRLGFTRQRRIVARAMRRPWPENLLPGEKRPSECHQRKHPPRRHVGAELFPERSRAEREARGVNRAIEQIIGASRRILVAWRKAG